MCQVFFCAESLDFWSCTYEFSFLALKSVEGKTRCVDMHFKENFVDITFDLCVAPY